jgi:hypothetical protein
MTHWDFTEAGPMTSTLEIPASRARSSAVPMPWRVFPNPISSAMIALPAAAANAIPSSW